MRKLFAFPVTMRQFKVFPAIAAIAFAFVFAANAKADPINFSNAVALQNGGNTRVDLFSHPGAVFTGPSLSFLVDVSGALPQGGADILQITFAEAGRAPVVQSFDIPRFNTIPPPFTQFFTFIAQNAGPQGTPVTLTIDLLSTNPDFQLPGGPNAGTWVNSYSYQFAVAQPTPEPTTLLLLGTGLSGFAAAIRRRRERK